MYIKDVELTQENLIVYYPTLYISNSDTIVNINQIIITGSQNLQTNNKVTLFTEKNPVLSLIKQN